MRSTPLNAPPSAKKASSPAIPAWWNAKNRANPKPVAVSNIPNANPALRGEHFQRTGDFRRAKLYFLKAHRAFPSFETAQKLGDVCRQLEEFSPAKRWYLAALEFDPQNTDAKLGLALCLRGEGKYLAAVREFKKCLAVYQRQKDDEAMAYVHWAIGTTLRFAKQYPPAEKNLRQSLALAIKLKDKSSEAYARAGLGGTLRMRGRAEESGKEYRRAYAIFRREKDRFGLAYSSCGQGNALRMQKNFKAALPFMKRAISIYKSLKLKGPRAYVLWSLSQAELGLSQTRSAQAHLKEAKKLFISVNDRRGLEYVRLGMKNPAENPVQIP